MCNTKPHRRVKAVLAVGPQSLPPATHLLPQEGSVASRRLLPAETSSRVSPTEGSATTNNDRPASCASACAFSSDQPSPIVNYVSSSSWANASWTKVTNSTQEALAGSPGTKVVDDSWPTLEALYDEIEVQKSQLEAERSLFGLAAFQANRRRCTTSDTSKQIAASTA